MPLPDRPVDGAEVATEWGLAEQTGMGNGLRFAYSKVIPMIAAER